jgi:4-hydroxybenzoate polyprenyltransferase
MKRLARRWATILWPAFLVAAVLEIAVFAFVDPLTLHTLDGEVLPLSATAVYSIAFLVFWACTAVACGLTVLLDRSADEINARPLAGP